MSGWRRNSASAFTAAKASASTSPARRRRQWRRSTRSPFSLVFLVDSFAFNRRSRYLQSNQNFTIQNRHFNATSISSTNVKLGLLVISFNYIMQYHRLSTICCGWRPVSARYSDARFMCNRCRRRCRRRFTVQRRCKGDAGNDCISGRTNARFALAVGRPHCCCCYSCCCCCCCCQTAGLDVEGC